MDKVVRNKEELFHSMEMEVNSKMNFYLEKLNNYMKKNESESKQILANFQLSDDKKCNLISECLEENIKFMIMAQEECKRKIKNIITIKQLELMKYYHKVSDCKVYSPIAIKEAFTDFVDSMNSYRDNKLDEVKKNFYSYLLIVTRKHYSKFVVNNS